MYFLPVSGDVTVSKIWSLLLKILQAVGVRVGRSCQMDRQLQSSALQARWVEAQGAKEDLVGPLVHNVGGHEGAVQSGVLG